MSKITKCELGAGTTVIAHSYKSKDAIAESQEDFQTSFEKMIIYASCGGNKWNKWVQG